MNDLRTVPGPEKCPCCGNPHYHSKESIKKMKDWATRTLRHWDQIKPEPKAEKCSGCLGCYWPSHWHKKECPEHYSHQSKAKGSCERCGCTPSQTCVAPYQCCHTPPEAKELYSPIPISECSCQMKHNHNESPCLIFKPKTCKACKTLNDEKRECTICNLRHCLKCMTNGCGWKQGVPTNSCKPQTQAEGPEEPEVIGIELTQGERALIDAADADLVSRFTWRFDGRYAVTEIDGCKVYLHRLLRSPPPGMMVDHLNRVKLDNRRANLIVCSRSWNNRNKAKMTGTGSRFPGAYWFPERKKWQAKIRVDGKSKCLGYFDTEEEAGKAYQDAVEAIKPRFT